MRTIPLCLLLLFGACSKESAPSDTVTDERSPLTSPALANEIAPETFRARLETTKGDIVIESERKWSPHGVDRLYNLIRIGYFRETPFYRMMPDFVAQFGFTWDPKINLAWQSATLPAEPNRVSNMRGHIAFGQGQAGPGTRTCQFFINLKNNSNLDRQGFPTVARIVEGWDVVQRLNFEYGGKPRQERIAKEGVNYLEREFPQLDYIKKAEILE